MAWIKRNLFFVIGSFIALVLMGVGGYWLYTQIALESQVADQIAAQYAELTRLNNLNPNPGDTKTIDNVKATKEEEAQLRAYINKMTPFFQRITPIPDAGTNKVSNSEFAAELRNTVALLRKSASQQSVLLPEDYYFTFEAQRKTMIFDPASLDKMAVELGDIKGICEIFFNAKVNSLDAIRRESVSVNDNNPPDYLPQKTTVTPLADLVPYEVTFRCFSTELGTVMSSLANSPYGFIVKTINVEPTNAGGTEEGGNSPTAMQPVQPVPQSPMMSPGFRGRGFDPRMMTPQPAVAPAPAPTRASQVFLNEKPFRVTMLINIVKIKPAAK